MNYPIVGYAPGHYMNTCVSCKKEFLGDKLACQCELCAIESAMKVIESCGEVTHVEQKIYYNQLMRRSEELHDQNIIQPWAGLVKPETSNVQENEKVIPEDTSEVVEPSNEPTEKQEEEPTTVSDEELTTEDNVMPEPVKEEAAQVTEEPSEDLGGFPNRAGDR